MCVKRQQRDGRKFPSPQENRGYNEQGGNILPPTPNRMKILLAMAYYQLYFTCKKRGILNTRDSVPIRLKSELCG